MNKIFDFDVIVIGGNHINTLGVVRSLGENKIYPYLIVIGKKKSYISKSKYVKESYCCDSSEEKILDILTNKINILKKRCYLIPTSDYASSIIDKNLKKLSKKYILPSINNKENYVNKYMDKFTQYELSKECNIKMPKTVIIDLEKQIVDNKIYPCILKPCVSAKGEKSDIRICNTKGDYYLAIEEFKEKKYNSVLLQEFIDYEYEYDVPGYSDGINVYIPSIIKKYNIYPVKRGSTSYGLITNANVINLEKIKKLFKKINYNGIFDIELFYKNNTVYLNEINFRNSAISYGLTRNKEYIAADWIFLNEKINNRKTKNKRDYFFMVEDYNLKLVLSKNISVLKFIKELIYTKKYAYINFKDPKPLFYKILFGLKKEK